MPWFPVLILSLVTFTTHFPQTRGNPTYTVAHTIYAVNAGVLYRSDDGGASFAARSSVAGTSVVVDPTNAEIVYDVAGLRRSDDGGATWKPFGGGASGIRIAIHPANPAELRLFGACSSSHPAQAGVFVSHDRGDSWQQDTSACTFDIAFDPLPPYSEYRAGLFGSGAALPARQVVGGPGVLYGLATSPRNVILTSDDGGATWTTFSAPPADAINVLAFDGTRLFAGTTAGLFVNANAWQYVPAAPPGPVLGLAIVGDLLYVTTASGLYRATLSTLDRFTPAAALPLIPAVVRGLAADPHAPRVYATADGVWRSDDGGEHWQSLGSSLIPRGAIAVDGTGDVYAFDDSAAGVETPVNLFHYDAATGQSEQFSSDLALNGGRVLWADPHRQGVLYTNKNGLLYRSGDGGHTWQIEATFNDGTRWIALSSISFDRSRPGVIYAATEDGLFRTLDDGVTWTPLDATGTRLVEVAPSHPATLYRAAGSTLSRSDDGGAMWSALPSPLPVLLAVDPLNERSVWLADGASKLYHSIDGGATWPLAAQFTAPLSAIVIESDGTHLHVAAPGEWDATIRAARRRVMLSP